MSVVSTMCWSACAMRIMVSGSYFSNCTCTFAAILSYSSTDLHPFFFLRLLIIFFSCPAAFFYSCGAWRQYRRQRSTCSAQQVPWRQRHHAGRREYVASGTETAIAESQQRQQQQQPSGKSAPHSISGSKAPSGSALMDEPISYAH